MSLMGNIIITALDKMGFFVCVCFFFFFFVFFFQSKSIDIFLNSPQKYMLWVLIRSALVIFHGEIRKIFA